MVYSLLYNLQTGLGAASVLVCGEVILTHVFDVLKRPTNRSAVDLLEALEAEGKIKILEDITHTYRGHRVAVVGVEPWPGLTKKI